MDGLLANLELACCEPVEPAERPSNPPGCSRQLPEELPPKREILRSPYPSVVPRRLPKWAFPVDGAIDHSGAATFKPAPSRAEICYRAAAQRSRYQMQVIGHDYPMVKSDRIAPAVHHPMRKAVVVNAEKTTAPRSAHLTNNLQEMDGSQRHPWSDGLPSDLLAAKTKGLKSQRVPHRSGGLLRCLGCQTNFGSRGKPEWHLVKQAYRSNRLTGTGCFSCPLRCIGL